MNEKKQIAIGSDHGAWELKEVLKEQLCSLGYEVRDFSSPSPESVDYPDIGKKVARAVASGDISRGVLLCGTGIGMSLAANKYPGVRAALCHDEYTARMSREHNDANILVLGGRVLGADLAKSMLALWLNAPYAGGRHQRRLDKITRIEQESRNRHV